MVINIYYCIVLCIYSTKSMRIVIICLKIVNIDGNNIKYFCYLRKLNKSGLFQTSVFSHLPNIQ